jgi:phospholipid transport system substrate-binding protein
MYKSIICYFFAFSAFVMAADSKDPAAELQSAINASLEVVYGAGSEAKSDPDKQQAVRGVLESHYDLTILIRRAMGRNWELLKESEQEEVIDLIKQLVVKAYVKNLNGSVRPKVSYGKTIQISENRIEIPSTIVADGTTYYVTYRLGLLPSGWEIYDIVAENISVVSNYRQQLDDHFQRGTGAELIKKLKNILKNEEFDNEIKI